jgi:hypothetical protein
MFVPHFSDDFRRRLHRRTLDEDTASFASKPFSDKFQSTTPSHFGDWVVIVLVVSTASGGTWSLP